MQCAQQMLGPFGKPHCWWGDLRGWSLALAERGGKSAKKKAIIAVALELTVLLHMLWKTGQVFKPLRMAKRKAKRRASAPAPAAATPTEAASA